MKRCLEDGLLKGNVKVAVSVVICCYNQSRYLSEAIESVLRQSYTPIQLTVVDDGSSDDTHAVATRFSNIKYLYQRNSGLASARNAGLRASTGLFIAFLDADDRLLPHALQVGLRNIQKYHDCAFVAGGFQYIDDRGCPLHFESRASSISNTYSDFLRFNTVPMPGAVLYRRATLNSVGGFNERLGAAEDYDLYLRLSRRYQFAQYQDIIAEYRQHQFNMHHDIGRMLIATVSVLEAQRPFVKGFPNLEAALNLGLDHYQSSYGRALIRKAVSRVARPHEWGTALHEIALMLKLAPGALRSGAALALAAALQKVRQGK